jgi:hypothetical protein
MAENEFIHKPEDVSQVANTEATKPKRAAKKPSNKPGMLVQIINGEFLTRSFFLNNLGFIFYIIFLLLLVVGKGYYGKQLSKDVETTQKELDELTADYVEAKTKFEEETRRYKLVMKLGPKGLTESENETKVIRIKRD